MKNRLVKLGVLILTAILLISSLSITAFAEVTSLPDNTSSRILNIYKYSPSTNPGDAGDGTTESITNRVPLQNVEFEIYKIPAGTTVTGTAPTESEIKTIKVAENLIDTILTNDSGLATKTFGTGTAADGTYLIVEKDNPAVTTQIAPFYVSLPLTDPDTQTGWLYTVTVYPKNDVPDPPTIKKDVDSIGNKHSSHNIGDIETWIIRGDVPADLHRTVGASATDVYGKVYKITDNLPSTLDYKGNLQVALFDKTGTEQKTKLTLTDHYTVSAPATTSGGTLVVTLTDAGKKYIMANIGTGDTTPEVRVYFDTAINTTATMGVNIPNTPTLDYTNSANNQYNTIEIPEKDRPEVHMGGLVLDKYKNGSETTKLVGATFKIARIVAEGETVTGAETITIGGKETKVVFVDFYAGTIPAASSTATNTVTTDNTGKAVLNGLAYGDYYLIETKAPDGYNLLTAPVKVTVTESSHNDADSIVKIANSAKFILPVTGGSGTVLFTAGGVLLIGIAMILLVISRKKSSAHN